MGSSNYSYDAYSYFSSSAKTKSVDDVFTQNKAHKIADSMDPKGLKFREARDSANHPESLAIMIWLDVTGSMGTIPEIIIKEKLDKIMSTLITHGVKDAAVFFGAIGDHDYDSYPLQVGQFESGTDELIKCLSSVYIEKGGGGNSVESYCLGHFVAGRHTSIDCYEKRGQKGFLFTIGDEGNQRIFSAEDQIKIFGYEMAEDVTDKQMLESAQRMYNVFHIHCNETQYKNNTAVLNYWKNLLGERLIIMPDHKMVAEIIASTIAVMNGSNIDIVTSSFDSKTANVVKTALAKVDMGINKFSQNTGIVTL